MKKLWRVLDSWRYKISGKKKEANKVELFLENYFNSLKDKTIIQIGANDGIQNDPIRKYIKTPGNFKAILIEPIPYYVQNLKKIYEDRSDIQIIQAAAGYQESLADLYFIPPKVAELMNGDGPFNNWAHGQGSFNKDTVLHWIEENKFRGDLYKSKLQYFKDSIMSITVHIKKTSTFIPDVENILLIIDVQGFEYDVLMGLSWDGRAPSFIMIEDDLDSGEKVDKYLKNKGYKYLCGANDKVYSRN